MGDWMSLNDIIIEYENLLNDYTINLFYGGLDCHDYQKLCDVIANIKKLNSIYISSELEDIEKRLNTIYNELGNTFEYSYLNLRDLIFQESSLLHLVFTNNNFNPINLYSRYSFKFLCQFHREKTPSMGVTNGRNLFYCFGCGEHGDAVSYIMKHEKLSYEEAVGLLARIYLIDIDYNLISENNELVYKYREILLSKQFKKLLVRGYKRSIKRDDNVDGYQKAFNIINRVKNNEHIKYIREEDRPKKLVYNLPF